MKYLCLIYDEEKKRGAMSQSEADAFTGEYFAFTERTSRRKNSPVSETRSAPSGASCRWSRSRRSTSSTARTVARICAISSRAAASSLSTISCSIPAGTRAARAARTAPIISRAPSSISPRATRSSRRSPARRSRRSNRSRGAWGGASPGSLRSATTSTTTSTSRWTRPPAASSTAAALHQAGKLWSTKGELPGLSVFLREGDSIFHTYSTYQRGLDLLLNTYNYLDLMPLGRQEDHERAQGWIRHHDKYPA